LKAIREAAEVMLINEFEDKRILLAIKIITLIIYSCAVRYHPRETGDSNDEKYATDQKYTETPYKIFVRRGDQIDLNYIFI
jgi:hypothetical protein